ncbi:GTPase IMAP family member 7-like [Triplophysa rosa]|uniref:GTPase IMAP family member 7-like n=1 Tax=Triplophysa rosa TaxID=992332 RepID=A0A9W7TRQ1_TRIRA|nr:GTPase IMAP family member 7-like [Triplophysa rosa]KAI7804088.1 putative GTPase IMAP family member 7-like [Triplophysa rosa]
MAETEEPSAAGGSADVRMVLLGQTGSGRSSAGNTILGREAFWTDVSPVSVTGRCQRAEGVVEGRRLEVIDTPGFFHTCLTPDEVRAELSRCVKLAEPGPHVFLLVLRPCRQTREQRSGLDWFSTVFGPQFLRHTLVLITWGDALREKPAEGFLKESEELWEFVGECAGGRHVFENTRGREERSQVVELLKKTDLLIQRNEGTWYTVDMLLQAETAIRHIQRRILGEDGEEEAERGGRDEEEARKRAERLFWYELVTAVGRGAVEGSGVMEKGKGKGKKVKAVQRAAAIASTPLSITIAAKVMGGAIREGVKVLQKHKKTFPN